MEIFAWFDLILIALILILGIKGLISGFVREIFGLIGLIGGVFLASRFAMPVGEFINDNIFSVQKNFWYHLGFLTTLIIFWIVCIMLGYALSKLLKVSGLGIFDRIFGFLVGSAKIFLVFAIFVFIISRISILNEKLSPYVADSLVYPLLLRSGEFIMSGNMPQFVKESQNNLDELQNTLQNLETIKKDNKNIQDNLLKELDYNIDTNTTFSKE